MQMENLCILTLYFTHFQYAITTLKLEYERILRNLTSFRKIKQTQKFWVQLNFLYWKPRVDSQRIFILTKNSQQLIFSLEEFDRLQKCNKNM